MKAIVIDDEVEIRKGLMKYVRWKALGVDDVIALDSAEAAKEYIMENQPELIVSDIHLPGMNGLQLGEWIREQGFFCRIIFISAYTERAYMKKALQLFAEDYIDKPISVEQIEDTVRKTVLKILADKEEFRKKEEAEQVLNLYTEQVMEMVAKDLLAGKWNEELVKKLAGQGIQLRENDQFLCWIIKCEKKDDVIDITELVEMYARYLPKTRCVKLRKSSDIMVYVTAFDSSEYLTSVHEEMEKLKKFLGNRMEEHQNLYVSVSKTCKSFAEIPQIYFQAFEGIQKLFFKGYNHFCSSEEKAGSEVDSSRIPYEKLRNALMERDEKKVLTIIDDIYCYLKECTGTLANLIKAVYYDMHMLIFQIETGSQNYYTDKEKNYLWMKINAYDTIQQCHEDLREKIENFFENETAFYSDNKVVNQIVTYVRGNYGNSELSVKDIADEVHLTPAYVIALFKEYTNMTIGQLIKTIRMENAQIFLRDTQVLMKDISKKCGYTDQNYFTKVFRKEFNMTPTEYREKYVR